MIALAIGDMDIETVVSASITSLATTISMQRRRSNSTYSQAVDCQYKVTQHGTYSVSRRLSNPKILGKISVDHCTEGCSC